MKRLTLLEFKRKYPIFTTTGLADIMGYTSTGTSDLINDPLRQTKKAMNCANGALWKLAEELRNVEIVKEFKD